MNIIASLKNCISNLTSKENKEPFFVFLCLFFFLVIIATVPGPFRFGDASEYILSTESIVLDHDLIAVNSNTGESDIDRHYTIKDPRLDSPAGIFVLDDNQGNKRYGQHPLYYAFFNVPFYAFFSMFGLQYYSFQFFNAIMFFFAILFLFLYLKDFNSKTTSLIFSMLLFFMSCAISYIYWIHTENFLLFLISGFFYFFHKKRYFIACIFLGIAGTSKIPFFLLYGVVFYQLFFIDKKRISAFMYGLLTISFILPFFAYNLFYFGMLDPMSAGGWASISFFSFKDFLYTLFGVEYGLIWFYPVIFFTLYNTKYNIKNSIILFLSIPIIVMFNFTINLYSHQVGWRYLNGVFPLFLFVVGRIKWNKISKILILVAILLSSSLFMFSLHNSESMNIKTKYFLPFQVSYILGYNVHPEVYAFSNFNILTEDKFTANYINAEGFTQDGWSTPGLEHRTLLFTNINESTVLDICLATGKKKNASSTYYFKMRLGNTIKKYNLRQGVNCIKFDVKDSDILYRNRPWPANYFYINFDSDYYSLSDFGSNDPRRLGFLLINISSSEKVFYQNPILG